MTDVYIAIDENNNCGLSEQSFTEAFERLTEDTGADVFECTFYIATRVDVEMKIIPKSELVPVEAPRLPRKK